MKKMGSIYELLTSSSASSDLLFTPPVPSNSAVLPLINIEDDSYLSLSNIEKAKQFFLFK
jgi:hypothetical protein